LFLNSDTLSTQNVTVGAEPHTLHFTGSGSVALSGAFTGSLAGTGTGENNRVSLTFTPTAGTLTITVTGTVTNAMVEEGLYATSYFSSGGSQGARAADISASPAATREADDCVRALGDEFNPQEGTFIFRCTAPQAEDVADRDPHWFEVSDGTMDNRIFFFKFEGGNEYRFTYVSNGDPDNFIFDLAAYEGLITTFGFSYSSGVKRLAINGVILEDSVSSDFPAGLNKLLLGFRSDGNRHVQSSLYEYVNYIPEVKTAAELITLTGGN